MKSISRSKRSYFAIIAFLCIGLTSTNLFAQREFPVMQTVQQNGTCIGCTTENPNGTIDRDLTTFTRYSVELALVGGFIEQTIIFPTVSTPGVPVRFALRNPRSLLNLALAGNIQIVSANGTTVNADATSLNQSGVVGANIQLNAGGISIPGISSLIPPVSGGGSPMEFVFTPTGNYDRVTLRLTNTGLSAIRGLDAFYFFKDTGPSMANRKFASSQVSASSATCLLCAVTNPDRAVGPNLNDASTLNTTLGLLGGSVSQTLIFDDNTLNGGCDSLVIMFGLPSTTDPGAVLPITLLSAQVLGSISVETFNGTQSNSDRFTLDSVIVGANLIILDDPRFARLILRPSKNLDRVRITVTNTVGLLNSINVFGAYKAKTNLNAPVVISPVEVCAGVAVSILAQKDVAESRIFWYDAPVGGNLLFIGDEFVGAFNQSTSIYAEAVLGDCSSTTRKKVDITVKASPPAPVVNNSLVTIQAGQTATLSVVPVAGVQYRWYTIASGGFPVAVGSTITTPALSSSINYFVEAFSISTACANPSRGIVRVVVEGTPPREFPSGNLFCDKPNKTAFSSPDGINLVAIPPNPALNPNLPALTCLLCIGKDGFKAIDDSLETFSILEVDVSLVSGFVEQGFGWATKSSLGDTIKVRMAATAGGLITRDLINLINDQLTPDLFGLIGLIPEPVPTIVGFVDFDLFNLPLGDLINARLLGSIEIKVNNGSFETSRFILADNNTFLGTGAVVLEPIGLLGNTVLFDLSFVPEGGVFDSLSIRLNGGLVGAFTELNIFNVVRTVPRPTVASDTVSACPGSTVTLTATGPANATFEWFDAPVGGNLLATGINFNVQVTSDTVTYWVQTRRTTTLCTSLDRTPVVVIPGGINITVTSNANNNAICLGQPVTLTATSNTLGVTFRWFLQETGGTPVFTGSVFSIPNLTQTTTYFVEGSIAGQIGACDGTPRTQITVTVVPVPATPTVASANVSTCVGSPVTLQVSPVIPGLLYRWYRNPDHTTPEFEGPSYTVNGLTETTIFFVEAIDPRANCASSARAQVTVTILPTPETPTVTADASSVCAGSTTTLRAVSSTPNVEFRWFLSETGGTPIFIGANFTPFAINDDITYYVEAGYTNSTCASNMRAAITITVRDTPDPPMVFSNNVNVCEGNQATLLVSPADNNLEYRWYATATGGTILFTGPAFTTPALTQTTSYFVEAFNPNSMCASVARTEVVVNVNPAPNAAAVTPTIANICTGQSATFTATSNTSNVTFRWYTQASGGTPIFIGSTFTTPALTQTTTYFVEVASNSTGCVSTSRTSVTANVTQVLSAPVVTCGTSTNNSITFTWQAVPNADGYEISLNNGTSFQTPSSGNNGLQHVVSGLNPGESRTIVVRAIKSGASCATSANSQPVTCTTTQQQNNRLDIPNAFTPNNDGKNDIFLAYGSNIRSFNMKIFNQWGEMVFESNDILNGWDGTFKGERQPIGTYVYVVEASFNDGEQVIRKGSITLIR